MSARIGYASFAYVINLVVFGWSIFRYWALFVVRND